MLPFILFLLTLTLVPSHLLHSFTNSFRHTHSLPPLYKNSLLDKIAQEHADSMAKREKLDHDRFRERMVDSGVEFKVAGENVARGNNMKEVMRQWKLSKGHRENILNKGYTDIGIGIARSKKGNWYFVQVFVGR